MKRRGAPSHENNERWLVSYADFITLLFAFFVVMFATNQSDKNRAKMVSDSVRDAIEHGAISSRLSNVLGRGKHDPSKPAPKDEQNLPAEEPQHNAAPADLATTMAVLSSGLEEELKSGKVGLKQQGRGLVISLREAAFFGSGDDALEPGSLVILSKIAPVIQAVPNSLRLEGHTDAIPIHNSRFRSNWELSTARAITMLEILAERYKIPRDRMAVAGYAENAPADSNDTDEGRAHNRRVDLVLLSQEGEEREPEPAKRKSP
jgi:chemotaxis protein MotB